MEMTLTAADKGILLLSSHFWSFFTEDESVAIVSPYI
jgi:hypothetical protein